MGCRLQKAASQFGGAGREVGGEGQRSARLLCMVAAALLDPRVEGPDSTWRGPLEARMMRMASHVGVPAECKCGWGTVLPAEIPLSL